MLLDLIYLTALVTFQITMFADKPAAIPLHIVYDWNLFVIILRLVLLVGENKHCEGITLGPG